MEQGIDCQVVELPSGDMKEVLAINALAHDAAMNLYETTSIQDMVDMAEKYRAAAEGGSWVDAQKALEATLGFTKRMFVYRSIVIAQSLLKLPTVL